MHYVHRFPKLKISEFWPVKAKQSVKNWYVMYAGSTYNFKFRFFRGLLTISCRPCHGV